MIAILLNKESGDDFSVRQYYIDTVLRTKTCVSNIIEIYEEPTEGGVSFEIWLLNQGLNRVHQYKLDKYIDVMNYKRAEKKKDKEDLSYKDMLFILGCRKIYDHRKKNIITCEQ